MSEIGTRMKEESEDEEDKMESVEKIPEKKEEVKEAAPLAYDMESGTLLNNREELSQALKNIRKCDSDGEEIEDDDDEEDSDEESEDDDDEDEDGGEILNPVPKFDSDGEAEEQEDEDDAEDNGGDDSEGGDEGENEPRSKRKKLNPMTIQEDEDDFDEDQDKKEPKLKKKKLEPILTQVSQKGDSILSSYAKFRSAIKKLEIRERITLVNSLCKKITSGTDADRQAKLRSLFQFSILSFMRNELHDIQEKSIVPVLYTICEKCPTIGEIIIEVIKDFAD
jgi:hypothetical protein